ncbi:hypothetical protein R3P38DRAFT_2815840 [Favolaschia claudopus]|uniref:Uncharacterized protein n=1 Tax=Favolaschia claudopus TaxID=2862362 RepID=A0AAV9Z0G6_9AGAR
MRFGGLWWLFAATVLFVVAMQCVLHSLAVVVASNFTVGQLHLAQHFPPHPLLHNGRLEVFEMHCYTPSWTRLSRSTGLPGCEQPARSTHHSVSKFFGRGMPNVQVYATRIVNDSSPSKKLQVGVGAVILNGPETMSVQECDRASDSPSYISRAENRPPPPRHRSPGRSAASAARSAAAQQARRERQQGLEREQQQQQQQQRDGQPAAAPNQSTASAARSAAQQARREPRQEEQGRPPAPPPPQNNRSLAQQARRERERQERANGQLPTPPQTNGGLGGVELRVCSCLSQHITVSDSLV